MNAQTMVSLAAAGANTAMTDARSCIAQAWGHAGNATGTEAYAQTCAADAVVNALLALTITLDSLPERVAEAFGHR